MDPESYTYDKKKRACLENPKKEEPKKQEAPTPDKVEVKTIKKEKKAEVTVTKKTVTIKAKPDIKAIKKQVKKLSKKDCTKAGLRYSRKRKYCYLKCRSKSRKFNPEQFKCLKEEELKAIKAAAAKKEAEEAAEKAAAAEEAAAEEPSTAADFFEQQRKGWRAGQKRKIAELTPASSMNDRAAPARKQGLRFNVGTQICLKRQLLRHKNRC